MNPYSINPAALKRLQEEAPEETGEDNKKVVRAAFDEISWSEQDVLQRYLPFANNPDPVVRSKGLKIYREMMQDDQIKVCFDMRVQARLSSTWSVKAGKEGDSSSEEMAEFMTAMLRRMKGNFENSLAQIYSAIVYGFSISEKVFDYVEIGKYKGKIGIKAIKTREPFDYDFKTDAHGNLEGLIYIGMRGDVDDKRDVLGRPLQSIDRIMPSISQGTTPLGTIENPFPPEKFVIYSYNQMFGNAYGRSDLLAAFKWWIMKKHGSKFWAVWLERYASPFVRAIYKRDAGLKKDALNRMDDFIRNLSTRQGIRASDAWTIDPVQFNGDAGGSYEKAIESYNRYIAHAMLCPNLLGFTGNQGSGGGGSYSLGKKHFDAFVWVLEKMGRDTSEEIVGEQIIKPLIEINFGEVEEDLLPKFVFTSLEEEAIEVRSRIITMLSSGGVINPDEEWVREFLTLPKKDPGVELINPLAQKPGDPNNPDEEKKKGPFGNKKEEKKPEEKKEPKPEEKKEPKRTEEKKAQFKERVPTYFEAKMRAKKFESDLNSVEAALHAEASEDLEAIREDMIKQVEKKKIIENGSAKDIDRLVINIGPLEKTFQKWIVKVWLDSRLGALEELGRGGVTIEITRKFSSAYAEKVPMEPWEPLPPKEAIEFFKRKVLAKIINDDGSKTVVDLTNGIDLEFLKQRAFYIAGVVKDDLLNDAKQILLNGIKRQDEIGAAKDLKNLFNRYLDQGIEVDEELLTPARLNTIVRTNVSEAVNEGRAALMRDPDVEDFVQYFQYTAIMDQRTTDYCKCMDGKVFRMEDLLMLNPPAHYNCRSFTVPVTQFELDELKDQGRGIELSDPCSDRYPGFSDLKRSAVPMIPDSILDVAIPEAKGLSREDRIRKQIETVIVKCPYKFCGSSEIRFKKLIYNVVEFLCDACTLPFRVSNVGDIYLYDAGVEKWERVTEGLVPQYFSEPDFSLTGCPYRFCKSSKIKMKFERKGITHYECSDCTLPFRVSSVGEIYLYDAGDGSWKKVTNARH